MPSKCYVSSCHLVSAMQFENKSLCLETEHHWKCRMRVYFLSCKLLHRDSSSQPFLIVRMTLQFHCHFLIKDLNREQCKKNTKTEPVHVELIVRCGQQCLHATDTRAHSLPPISIRMGTCSEIISAIFLR